MVEVVLALFCLLLAVRRYGFLAAFRNAGQLSMWFGWLSIPLGQVHDIIDACHESHSTRTILRFLFVLGERFPGMSSKHSQQR
jgi:hypothetical protein